MLYIAELAAPKVVQLLTSEALDEIHEANKCPYELAELVVHNLMTNYPATEGTVDDIAEMAADGINAAGSDLGAERIVLLYI